jgi:hypothetical protein
VTFGVLLLEFVMQIPEAVLTPAPENGIEGTPESEVADA